MKILVISSFLPYPLFSGGHIRLYNLMKQLSKKYEITLICEKRNNQTQEDIKEVEKICKTVITVNRKKQWSFKNILKTGFSFYPFLFVGHSSKEMRQVIQKSISSEQFDLIHGETSYVFQNIPDSVRLPIVLVEHNIEYLVYQRFVDTLNPIFRPLLQIDIAKLKYWEEKFWKKATKLVAVSEVEKKLMKRSDVVVVPNGVDIQKYQISNIKYQISKKEKKILFIGDFKWIQNRDAVSWILKDIWPKINEKLKIKNEKYRLWIVGRNIPDSIKKLTRDENVIFDDNASKDTAEIFANTDLLLAPIRVGGGTSFKILEAMASGVVVVTTPLGIEGLEVKEDTQILVGNTAEELAEQVLDILNSESRYKEIAINARQLIEQKYDWKIIAKKLDDVYISVV